MQERINDSMTDTDLNRIIPSAERELGKHNLDDEADDARNPGRPEQDVNDPDHGVITTPSPKHPGSDDSADLPEGSRVEGTEIKR